MSVTIGLTGGIASGKSTVSSMFKEWNIPVVDADLIARQVVEPGEEAYLSIIKTFGEELKKQDGTINREKLGSIVFHNEAKRMQLNEIVHPAVRKEMLKQKNVYIERNHKAVILDIPLLFESKLTSMVDKTIVVYVDADVQLSRLMKRNELTEKDAMARIQSQMPLVEKKDLADEVIDNNGSLEETRVQLHKVLTNWGIL